MSGHMPTHNYFNINFTQNQRGFCFFRWKQYEKRPTRPKKPPCEAALLAATGVFLYNGGEKNPLQEDRLC